MNEDRLSQEHITDAFSVIFGDSVFWSGGKYITNVKNKQHMATVFMRCGPFVTSGVSVKAEKDPNVGVEYTVALAAVRAMKDMGADMEKYLLEEIDRLIGYAEASLPPIEPVKKLVKRKVVPKKKKVKKVKRCK